MKEALSIRNAIGEIPRSRLFEMIMSRNGH